MGKYVEEWDCWQSSEDQHTLNGLNGLLCFKDRVKMWRISNFISSIWACSLCWLLIYVGTTLIVNALIYIFPIHLTCFLSGPPGTQYTILLILISGKGWPLEKRDKCPTHQNHTPAKEQTAPLIACIIYKNSMWDSNHLLFLLAFPIF